MNISDKDLGFLMFHKNIVDLVPTPFPISALGLGKTEANS